MTREYSSNCLANSIPQELRDRRQWVCWRYEQRKGEAKPTKVPINAQTGAKASTTNPKTWSSFEVTMKRLRAGRVDGIGYVFSDDHIGVDLDDAVDEQTGDLKPWAAEIVTRCRTYTERSPSGRGVHLITAGALRKEWTGMKRSYHDGTVEIYSRGRYFTMTGDRIETAPATIEDQSAFILELYKKISGSNSNGNARQRSRSQSDPIFSLNDRLEVAFRDPVFRRLWQGDTSANNHDDSAADLALCNKLVFYFGPDPQLMDSLFRQSRLMREKWDRADYRERTITTAIERTTETFHPRRNRDGLNYAGQQQAERSNSKAESESDGTPAIRVAGGTLSENVALAESYLATATIRRPKHGIYQRGGALVRVAKLPVASIAEGIRRAEGTLQILQTGPDFLRLRLTDAASFERFDKKSKEWVPIDAPSNVARTLWDAAGEWNHTPNLTGIVEAPSLRRDGTILDRPGYDRDSGLYFDTGNVRFPPIPDAPSRTEALAALDRLLSILASFPFLDEASKSVAVALLITPLVRHAVRAAPLTAISAPKMGSGKTLLANLPAYIATGREPALMSQAETPEEERKRLLAILVEGSTVSVIDNIERPLKSAVLCTALTEPIIRDRLLGLTKTVSVPTSTTWIATGNNIRIDGDLSSRTLLSTLDPRCERPEERQFDVNLHDYVPRHRGELVAAALTIVRAYISAAPKLKLPPFGRFEDWSHLVREPLVWLGLSDPCETRRVVEAREPVHNLLGNLLEAWLEAFDKTPQTVATAVKECEGATSDSLISESLKTAIEAIAEDSGRINTRRLGHFLANNENRIERGLRFERAGERRNALLWQVRKRDSL